MMLGFFVWRVLFFMLLIGKDLSMISSRSCLKIVNQLTGSLEINRKCVENMIEVISWHGIDVASDRLFNRFPNPEFLVQAFGRSGGISKRNDEIKGLFSWNLAEVLSEVFVEGFCSLLAVVVGVLVLCCVEALQNLSEPLFVFGTDDVRLGNFR